MEIELNTANNVSELFDNLANYGVVVFEGPKNSGKSYLSKEFKKYLEKSGIYYELYTPWKDRRIDTSFDTVLNADLTDSFIWVFDFIRQMEDPQIIMDRSMITTLMPRTSKYQYVVKNDELKSLRAQFYNSLMSDLNGITVLVNSNRSDPLEYQGYINVVKDYYINYLPFKNEIPSL